MFGWGGGGNVLSVVLPVGYFLRAYNFLVANETAARWELFWMQNELVYTFLLCGTIRPFFGRCGVGVGGCGVCVGGWGDFLITFWSTTKPRPEENCYGGKMNWHTV